MPKFKLKKSIDIQIDKAGVFFLPSGSELDLEEVEEAKEWPQNGDNYFYVRSDGSSDRLLFNDGNNWDFQRKKIGNCFRTEEEALKARDAIKELLKGMKKGV